MSTKRPLINTLTIRQQNLNKSETATWGMINTVNPKETDIIAIQEPYLDFLNRTRATKAWTTALPTGHYKDESKKSRALILVNSRLTTWEQIMVDSLDVVAVRLKTRKWEMLIVNIYGDINNSDAFKKAEEATRKEKRKISGNERLETIWLGDFNRHHPAWDELRNAHLFTRENLDKAQELINTIDEMELQMILPAAIPTLKALSTGNLTRPDNVYASEGIVSAVTECNTAVEDTPPKTDHFPIITKLNTEAIKREERQIPNFKTVDWETFRETLLPMIRVIPTDEKITNRNTVDARLKALTDALKATISKEVPISKISGFTKRWWTKELSVMNKTLRRIRNRCRKRKHDRSDPIHEEERKERNRYGQMIKDAKRLNWETFLEEVDERTIWTAHKYVAGEPTDGACSKMPPLKKMERDGTISLTKSEEEKSDLLFKSFFAEQKEYGKPAGDFKYPSEVFSYSPMRNQQIHKAIERLGPHKAPGANGIPNIVLIKTAEMIVPILGPLFRASMRLSYLPQEWKDSTIVIIRKPGKPDYAVPGAYRPIALLDTIGKVLAACITEDLLAFTDKCALLPPTQFGCRPGRTTTDALHYATSFIKNAWRAGDEVVALFMDIKAAFPSVYPEWLVHGMRCRGIPKEYTEWYKEMLKERRTTLTLDGYKAAPRELTIGLDQGRPDSGVAYALYSAGLADIIKGKKNHEIVSFADDTTIMIRAKTLEEGIKLMEQTMEQASEWSKTHNCQFAMDKFAMIGFSRRREKDPENPKKSKPRKQPSINLKGIEVKPTTYHKFLGILIDEELRFNAQTDYALKKGTTWVSQFRRLAKPTKGIAMKFMRRYYLTVAVPKMLYAADIFLTQETGESKGTIGKIKKLARIQREAAILITGAMRTTATDILDIHADLLPFPLIVEKHMQRAGTRLATIPDTHALHGSIKRAARRYVAKHRSPIHEVLHRNKIKPEQLETIRPDIWGPKWTHEHRVVIAENKEKALEEVEKYKGCHIIYTDGAGRDGKVGAAAIYTPRKGEKRKRRKMLGTVGERTVFEAELIGIRLALDIAKEIKYTDEVVICTDNQSAIKATTRQRGVPGQQLVELIQKEIKRLKQKQGIKILLVWTPGHRGLEGNEEADEEAGKAITEGDLNCEHMTELSNIPISRSAVRQRLTQELKEKAKRLWQNSPRFEKMKKIDETLPSANFARITDKLPRRNCTLLMQLRSGHAPLNDFLYKIGKVSHPMCQACEMEKETTKHFLVICPRYDAIRQKIQRELKCRDVSMKTLLSNPKSMEFLFEYINGTKRFENTIGKLKVPKSKGENKEKRGNKEDKERREG